MKEKRGASSSHQRPVILISNDDGVEAPGLAALEKAMSRLGDTLVCAPASERSAASHSISVNRPLDFAEHRRDGHIWATSLDGSPADCVKFAILNLLDGRLPDLVVSGVNAGANTGTNILYSGTVGAAMEGVLYGVPSIAVSAVIGDGSPHFDTAAHYAERLARLVLREGLPEGVALNLNAPPLPVDQIRGVVFSRMSRSMYIDLFRPHPDRPGDAFSNVGDRMRYDHTNHDNDEKVLSEGKVSITPLRFDWTHHGLRGELRPWIAELESDPAP